MANVLLKYLEDRYKHKVTKNDLPSPGPVITISRDFGCPANLCANDIAELLSKKSEKEQEPWKVISKEILEHAAQELGLTPDKIEFVFNFEKRNVVDEVLEALSAKYYKSERKIRNTIKDVIRTIGEKGRVIIIGRAGSTILHDIPKSLHVKLIAPLDDRVNGVSRRHKISHSEAKKLTMEMDKNRTLLRNEFAGKQVSIEDYDLILNCKNLNSDEIVDIIVTAAVGKDLI